MTTGAVDPQELRRCLGSFVTGVTVITALDGDGHPVGMTANSFNSVSLDPPLIVWSLRLNSRSFADYAKARRFVVNILAEDQIEVSNRFAKWAPDRFDGVEWTPGAEGVPLLAGCAAHLECRAEASYPGGDHMLFLGRVERIDRRAVKPLAFGAGRYMVVHPYEPAQAGGDAGNVATLNAVHLARPVIEDVSRATDRTVGLAVWGNFGPTVIWWVEGSRPLQLRARCGMVLPLLTTSTGRAFAAFSSPERIEPFLEAELAAARRGDGSPFVSRREVEEHLREVRAGRLATIREVLLADMHMSAVGAASVPVFDAAGEIVLVMTMVGESPGFEQGDPAVARLADSARTLSARLGYKG